jgi:hypothetical protein
MSKGAKRFLYKFGSLLILVITVFLVAYFISVDKEQRNREIEKSITEYMNSNYLVEDLPDYSPLYGLLMFNFTDPSLINTATLIHANFFYYSLMSNSSIDKIYKDRFGVTRAEYESTTAFVADPTMNCYYNQIVLRDPSFKCNTICKKSTSEIMQNIKDQLGWDSVLPSDAAIYCEGMVMFYNGDNIYVDLNNVRTVFKEITGSELAFDNSVTSKEEYRYGAYILNDNLRLSDYIVGIKNVDVISANGDDIEAYYTGIMLSGGQINGQFKLKKNNRGYYIKENKVETAYYIK